MTDTDLCTACYQYPPETPGMWICTHCADQWHYHLTALIGYRDDRGHWQRGWLDELGVENRRQARKSGGGPRVTASPERPEPANRAASDVAQEIRFHLVTAALQLAKVDSLELPADRLGRPLPSWPQCRQLRPGELFLLSATNPASFDSRYFGPVSASAVIGAAHPIWLEARP